MQKRVESVHKRRKVMLALYIQIVTLAAKKGEKNATKFFLSCRSELELAPECQAHSEDQICVVNGFTVRRIMDIMWM